eukprot:9368224-Lingulodinium_polyedra.AAC.1
MAPCAVARPSSRAYVCLAVASPLVLSGRLTAHVVAKHSGCFTARVVSLHSGRFTARVVAQHSGRLTAPVVAKHS